MNSNNYIYVIEDSLALLVSFVPNFAAQYESAEAYLREYNMNRYLEEDYSGDEFEHFAIEEIRKRQRSTTSESVRVSATRIEICWSVRRIAELLRQSAFAVPVLHSISDGTK